MAIEKLKTVLKSSSRLVSSTFNNFGQVLRLKITPLNVVMAVLIWGTFGAFVFPEEKVSMKNPNVIYFSQEFAEHSTDRAEKFIQEINKEVTPNERALIVLTSPGGSVFDGKVLQEEVRNSKVPVDVYIPAFGASMAADTFMLGERRFVDEDALVLFHGAHGGNYGISEPILGHKLEILKSVEFKNALRSGKPDNNLPDNVKNEHMKLLSECKQKGYELVLMETASLHGILKAINDSMIDRMARTLGWTSEKVRNDLFGNLQKDMTFSGRQLMEMGVATGLGRPNYGEYKE